jgi:hypothetical protein
MKRPLLVLATLVLTAPAVQAGGINLTWGSGCWQDNPATLHAFACDSNAGSATLTASFAFDRAPGGIDGFEAALDLQSDSSVLPDWWQLTPPGGCRQGALSGSADFTGAPGGCVDAWQGHAHIVGTAWHTALFPGGYNPPPALNRAKLWIFVLTDGPLWYLQSGIEYYGFKVTVDHQKSVGPGACGGCSTPVTIVLNEMWAGEHGWKLTNPLANTCVRWQAGGLTPCSATPAQNPTWGRVKSLYR